MMIKTPNKQQLPEIEYEKQMHKVINWSPKTIHKIYSASRNE